MSRSPGARKEFVQIRLPRYAGSHIWVDHPEDPNKFFGVQLTRDYWEPAILSASEYDKATCWVGFPYATLTAVRGLSAYIETLPDGSTGRNDISELQVLADLITSMVDKEDAQRRQIAINS